LLRGKGTTNFRGSLPRSRGKKASPAKRNGGACVHCSSRRMEREKKRRRWLPDRTRRRKEEERRVIARSLSGGEKRGKKGRRPAPHSFPIRVGGERGLGGGGRGVEPLHTSQLQQATGGSFCKKEGDTTPCSPILGNRRKRKR